MFFQHNWTQSGPKYFWLPGYISINQIQEMHQRYFHSHNLKITLLSKHSSAMTISVPWIFGVLSHTTSALLASHREHQGLFCALCHTQPGNDSPGFIPVAEGRSLLFPATFIYRFTLVSMETSHDIRGWKKEVERSAGAAGSQWHRAEQMLKLEKCNFSAKSNEISGRRVEKY